MGLNGVHQHEPISSYLKPMGAKGDKHTNEAKLTVELVVERLQGIGGITQKKMFGGHGIFHDGKMFGIVDSKGNFALKVDESLEKEYLKMESIKHGKMPYYSVPEEIFNSEGLIEWVKKSMEVDSK